MKLVTLLLITAISISTASPSQARSDTADGSTPVITKLDEIVSIRERMLEGKMALAERNRLPTAELINAQVALIESKVDLAKAKGEEDLIEGYLKQIVALAERKLASLQARDRAGTEGLSETIGNARIDLLQAELRLLRLQERLKES